MLRYWLWLATRKNLSFRDKMLVLEHFGTPESAYLADEFEIKSMGELSEKGATSLMDRDLKEVEKILRDCDNKHVEILTWQDAAYPSRLKSISAPPLVLYYQGRLQLTQNRSLRWLAPEERLGMG